MEKPFDWPGGAVLEEHSRRKHKILREYVFDYLYVRCRVRRSPFRLAIVDGFAGGGRYQCGTAGSPVIFLEELIRASVEVNIERAKNGLGPQPIECLLILNDASAEAIALLKEQVAPFLVEISQNHPLLKVAPVYLQKPFEAVYPTIKNRLIAERHRSVLFNLDQCGHQRVDRSTISDMMGSFHSVEIFYTFAIQSLIAFLKKDDPEVVARQVARLHIDPALFASIEGGLSKQSWMGAAERIVFESFQSCARYVSPFTINNPDGWRYWLIHFANAYRARQVYNNILHTNSSMQAVGSTGRRNTFKSAGMRRCVMVTSRVHFTSAQRAELWERWKRGESISSISRALDRRSKGGVQLIITSHGGIAPAVRRRAVLALRLEEREEISRGLAAGLAIRAIARGLGRSPSTICREIARNGGARTYRAARADKRGWEQARRPKRCRLACYGRLRRRVAQKLALQWSPEQIAGWLRRQYPGDPSMQISHEAIYRSLFIQSRGVLKKELTAHLRTRRQMRQAKGAKGRHGHGKILDMVSIRERPAEAEDRAVPGHWEGDLLVGTNDTQIATLVERHSRFTMLVKVPRKDSTTVVTALAEQIRKLPEELWRSLTWDQGTEMSRHKAFSLATNLQVYFCDPRSPWQRGSNENTNGLLRQYFPRGTNFSNISQAQLNAVALRLNQRPRKTLDFETPADRLQQVLR